MSKNNFQNLSDVTATGTVNSTFLIVTVIDIGQTPQTFGPFSNQNKGPQPRPHSGAPGKNHRLSTLTLRQGASDGLEESLTSQSTTECRSNQAQKLQLQLIGYTEIRWFVFLFFFWKSVEFIIFSGQVYESTWYLHMAHKKIYIYMLLYTWYWYLYMLFGK